MSFDTDACFCGDDIPNYTRLGDILFHWETLYPKMNKSAIITLGDCGHTAHAVCLKNWTFTGQFRDWIVCPWTKLCPWNTNCSGQVDWINWPEHFCPASEDQWDSWACQGKTPSGYRMEVLEGGCIRYALIVNLIGKPDGSQ